MKDEEDIQRPQLCMRQQRRQRNTPNSLSLKRVREDKGHRERNNVYQ